MLVVICGMANDYAATRHTLQFRRCAARHSSSLRTSALARIGSRPSGAHRTNSSRTRTASMSAWESRSISRHGRVVIKRTSCMIGRKLTGIRCSRGRRQRWCVAERVSLLPCGAPEAGDWFQFTTFSLRCNRDITHSHRPQNNTRVPFGFAQGRLLHRATDDEAVRRAG